MISVNYVKNLFTHKMKSTFLTGKSLSDKYKLDGDKS